MRAGMQRGSRDGCPKAEKGWGKAKTQIYTEKTWPPPPRAENQIHCPRAKQAPPCQSPSSAHAKGQHLITPQPQPICLDPPDPPGTWRSWQEQGNAHPLPCWAPLEKLGAVARSLRVDEMP